MLRNAQVDFNEKNNPDWMNDGDFDSWLNRGGVFDYLRKSNAGHDPNPRTQEEYVKFANRLHQYTFALVEEETNKVVASRHLYKSNFDRDRAKAVCRAGMLAMQQKLNENLKGAGKPVE
jgi:hypothetical protein